VRGIQARGKTVCLTTHLMEEAERLCDRVAIIEHGRIIDIDSPERLVSRHCPERIVVLATDDPGADARLRAMTTSSRASFNVWPSTGFGSPISAPCCRRSRTCS
jgi:ABC-2 type transport system ATP-binding protein